MIGPDPARVKAGAEYYAALKGLGFEPEALFWARPDKDWCLVMASPFFDAVGPLAISELLFKAYRASATPKEIDPFIVELHSPDHRLIRDYREFMRKHIHVNVHMKSGEDYYYDDIKDFPEALVMIGPYEIFMGGIYVCAGAPRNSNLAGRGAVVERMVEKLAA